MLRNSDRGVLKIILKSYADRAHGSVYLEAAVTSSTVPARVWYFAGHPLTNVWRSPPLILRHSVPALNISVPYLHNTTWKAESGNEGVLDQYLISSSTISHGSFECSEDPVLTIYCIRSSLGNLWRRL